jgi:hypothetical protein
LDYSGNNRRIPLDGPGPDAAREMLRFFFSARRPEIRPA